MKWDYLVVGAGFFGCVLAERLANDAGASVLVIDKRDHIGGNCHSQENPDTGIEYHTYGTHIFHTSSRMAWDYITKFSDFNGYHHKVLTVHNGKTYQFPINLATINSFYHLNLTPVRAREFLASEILREGIREATNLEERAISLVGRPLYEAFIRGYTTKQWDSDPQYLPSEIIDRLPVRYDYDSSYFPDARWQGIPLGGYASVFERLLDSPRIEVRLNCDYFEHRDELSVKHKVIYTGPIDRYFDYMHGKLEWRSVEQMVEVRSEADFQGTAVMNFADLTVPHTRIHEPRHLHLERNYPKDRTVILYEIPKLRDEEPCYPVRTMNNMSLLKKYLDLAKREKHVIIGGRLGGYAYIDMDRTILSALNSYRENFA